MPLDLFGIFSVREDQICTVTENAELNNFTALFQLPVAEDPPAETFTTGKAYRLLQPSYFPPRIIWSLFRNCFPSPSPWN